MGFKDRLSELFGRDDRVGAERRRIRADRQRIRAGRGRYQSMLDRQATPADLEQLREFTRTRRGVELYIEPETSATDTTAVAVAYDTAAFDAKALPGVATTRPLAAHPSFLILIQIA